MDPPPEVLLVGTVGATNSATDDNVGIPGTLGGGDGGGGGGL